MDAFFTQFYQFMAQLVQAYPNDPDFKMYSDGVALVQRINPSLVLSEFGSAMMPSS